MNVKLTSGSRTRTMRLEVGEGHEIVQSIKHCELVTGDNGVWEMGLILVPESINLEGEITVTANIAGRRYRLTPMDEEIVEKIVEEICPECDGTGYRSVLKEKGSEEAERIARRKDEYLQSWEEEE